MRRRIAAVVFLSLLLVLMGCPSTPPRLRVILLAIDGADWALIDPLIEKGQLPNFKHLRERGKTGELVSDYSWASPSIWNSIATGKLPEAHGIAGFVRRVPHSYHEFPFTSTDRKAAALWNILSHHDRSVCTVAWWASWPAEKVRGCIVTQRFFLSAFGVGPIGGKSAIGVSDENPDYARDARLLTWPEEIAPRLAAEFSGDVGEIAERTRVGHLIRELRQLNPTSELSYDLDVVENILQTDLLVAETVEFLERAEGPFDLTAFYIEGVDVVSHLFWKYLFPERWLEHPLWRKGMHPQHTRFKPMIPLYYEEVDQLLGRALSRAGETVMVVVVSDHGFRGWLDPFDYNYPANTLLEALGMLTTTDQGGVDYGRSRCFDYGSNPWDPRRPIYVNIRGSYSEGIVAPEQARATLNDLKQSLLSLRTLSGRRVVDSVAIWQDSSGLTARIHRGLPRHALVAFDDSKIAVSELFPPRTISGNHRPQGIVAFYGGGVAPGRLEAISSLDVTPTLLALLGLPVAEDMDGEPASALLTELNRRVTRESSFDHLLPDARAPALEEGVLDDEMKERLRALGYIQ